MRRYLKNASMQMTGGLDGGIALMLGTYVLRFVRVVVLLALWRTILSGKGGASSMTMDAILTYTLISSAFADQLSCDMRFFYELETGVIATRFLRPMGLFGQYGSQMVGGWGLSFLAFTVPLLMVSPLLGVSPLPPSFVAGMWFLMSLVAGISVGMAVEFIFGGLMIIFRLNAYNTTRIQHAASMLLSGALIPLTLMPWGLGRVFDWLPFAAMASIPLRIFTGTEGAPMLVLVQIGWSLALWPLAYLLWELGRERMVSYGG